jgi:uncharacterized protein (TIGR04255 family)
LDTCIDMAAIRHLTNAPITEALIDIRVTPSPALTTDALRQLAETAKPDYPQMNEGHGVEMSFNVIAGQTAVPRVSDAGITGYICRSADDKSLVQFRADGYTFNRLHPYTSWESIVPEAMRWWSLYAGAVKPTVIRIAVRYINRLTIPNAVSNLRQYLTVPPGAATAPDQRVTGFFSRVAVEDPRSGASALVTQVLDQSLDPNREVVVLDVDVFKVKAPVDAFTTDEIEPVLTTLRALKNQLFFGSVTEEALRPYL